MANLSQVIYINEEDYSTLLSEGEIEKNGETYYYDESALYVIKDVSVPEYAETAGYASEAGSAARATQDASGNNIVQTYDKKPLIITIYESRNSNSLPEGTYTSITNALAENREVIIKEIMDESADEILYYNFSIDYSIDSDSYLFYNSKSSRILTVYDDDSLDSESESPSTHSHGYIGSNGILNSSTTIASGDKLLFTDSSESNKIRAYSVAFDGSTTTKALSQKGTWETFYQKSSSGIPATDLTYAVQTLLTAAGTALQPSDITTLTNKVTALEDLVATDSDAVIDKFNEIVGFLNGINATDSLSGILEDIAAEISAKYSKPSNGIPATDLASEVLTDLV